MNESLEELACSYVFDQLDENERATFSTRLLHEPELAAYVRELESALVRGVHSLPLQTPPASTFSGIEAKIDALIGHPAPGVSATVPPSFRWAAVAQWGIAAVIAVSLGTLAVQSVRRSAASPAIVLVGLYDNQNSFTELPLRKPATDPDSRFIQLAGLAEGFWRQPANPSGRPDDNRGYALFDPTSRQGFIAIEQIAALPANQRYHLWIVDPATGRINDAGILPLVDAKRGLYSFALPPVDGPKSDRPGFFITAEENGTTSGPDQPHGKVVLGNRPI